MKKYPTATRLDDRIIIDTSEAPFGNVRLKGRQFKGVVTIDDEPFFVKLDAQNSFNSEHDESFDARYTSVADSIGSIIANNIHDDFLNTVNYEFNIFQIDDNIYTGTLSRNYLQRGEIEITVDQLNVNYKTIWGLSGERLEHLAGLLDDQNVADAEYKLLKQSYFDAIIGNNDRAKNPSNIVIAYSGIDHQGELVTTDYGTCLPTKEYWTYVTEDTFDEANLIMEVIRHSTGMTSDPVVPIEDLSDYDCDPLPLDLDAAIAELNEFKNRLTQLDVSFIKYAKTKIEMAKFRLLDGNISKLYENISGKETEQTFDQIIAELSKDGSSELT